MLPFPPPPTAAHDPHPCLSLCSLHTTPLMRRYICFRFCDMLINSSSLLLHPDINSRTVTTTVMPCGCGTSCKCGSGACCCGTNCNCASCPSKKSCSGSDGNCNYTFHF
ncbi:hypothetical protein Hamer_G030284 [Homarus americanus]|uniref:Metallothionein n=1 Tax=Homarus americanus TaxID=6706 RepID=A0A8J5MRL7_HOMAM|nr:hypothetical protein Hamer_G030284 [Homarus americanus]